jgi:hypothetical protein
MKRKRLKTYLIAIGCGAILGAAYSENCWVEETPPIPCDGTESIKCRSGCTQPVTNLVARCEQVASDCFKDMQETLTCSNCSTPCTMNDERVAYVSPSTPTAICATVQGVRKCVPKNAPLGED